MLRCPQCDLSYMPFDEYHETFCPRCNPKEKYIDEDVIYLREQKILDNVQKINVGFPNLEILICDYNIQDYEQMLLMSLCEHNIIANSSFSWWGAYFNNKSEKIVCYPSVWNGSTNKTHDLFPTNWNKIII